jgi:RHS repeat-associated protein
MRFLLLFLTLVVQFAAPVYAAPDPQMRQAQEVATFVPAAKITEKQKLSIATNYLGTPEAMCREDGEAVWTCELNSYGKVRNFQGGSKTDCPFRYQGQYEDAETGLYYNRFRYYSPEEGVYISQDPIRLDGGINLYSYVNDTNGWVDLWGLQGILCGTTENVENIEYVNPNNLLYTQRTAGGNGRANSLRESMAANGYQGAPIDVVRTNDGLVTIDNTRPAVAAELGITSIPANVHNSSETLPASMDGRFGNSTTWGESVEYRTSRQNPPLPSSGTSTPPKLPKSK